MSSQTSIGTGDPTNVGFPVLDTNIAGAQRLLDELVSRSLAYRTSHELKSLLDFTCRFPHLAPFNAMLLHIQNPGIRYALRAPVWERLYQRRIKPGARPYLILQTMGPVAFVFDLSDTEDMNLFGSQIPDAVLNPFQTRGQPPSTVMAKLCAACRTVGIVVTERDYGTEQAGCVQKVSGYEYDFSLRLNVKHTEAQKVATFAHELGHLFCGHLGTTEVGFWPDRGGLALNVREFEAEAVAYLVAGRMALDIGSHRYLASYLTENKPLPDYSLETVLKAAGKVEEMATGRFRLKKKKA